MGSGMLRHGAFLVAALALLPAPAQAQQQMSATEARSFVVGKLFSYVCFEGTRGAGRITDNGAVAGTIQFRGNGATRYAVLPQNTIRVVGERVCASVKGVPFQPCFNLVKTGASSFRGSVSGLGFAYCDFVRRDRPVIASAQQRARLDYRAAAAVGKTEVQPAPVKPVESAELPPAAEENAAAKESGGEAPLELRSSTR